MPRQCMGGGGAEGSSGTRAATDKASVGSRRPAWHQVDHAGPRRGGVEEVLGRRAREACGPKTPATLGRKRDGGTRVPEWLLQAAMTSPWSALTSESLHSFK